MQVASLQLWILHGQDTLPSGAPQQSPWPTLPDAGAQVSLFALPLSVNSPLLVESASKRLLSFA